MRTNETFRPVQSLRQPCRSVAPRLSRRDATPGSGVSNTGGSESQTTWSEAKAYVFDFGPRRSRPLEGFRLSLPHLASEFGIRKAHVDYLSAAESSTYRYSLLTPLGSANAFLPQSASWPTLPDPDSMTLPARKRFRDWNLERRPDPDGSL